MILNNPTTQQIAEIKSINNTIAYSVYENAHYRDVNVGDFKSLLWKLNKDLIPDALLSFRNNELKLAYDYLATLPEFTGFQIITDVQAWTLAAKPVRIFIDNAEIVRAIEANNGLNRIIEKLRDTNSIENTKFVFRGKTQSVIYLNTILEADRVVIAPYVGKTIFAENKVPV